MNAVVSTESDNDWLRRAGTRLEGGKLVLPHSFLMLPMTIASKAVVAYNADTSLANHIAQALVISIMVRCADTAFFSFIADKFNAASPPGAHVCHNCLRGQLFPNRLKELRALVNKHIIHKVEDGSGVGPTLDHIPTAIEYYNEIFTLPLTDPISWEARSNMKLCHKCTRDYLDAHPN